MQSKIQILHQSNSKTNIFTWIKDISLKYIGFSENFVALAGADSPNTMLGKDDYFCIWKEKSVLFRTINIQVSKGEIKYINTVESIILIKNGTITSTQLLVTKTPIFNKTGSAIEFRNSEYKLHALNNKKEKIWLPIPFGNQYLTLKEFNILKLFVLEKTAKLIAKELAIYPQTVEEHIGHIKYKLRCRYKYEIPSLIIEYGILQSMVLEPC